MQTLWLICDVSGSMIENGKRLIVRSLARQVEQYFRLGYALKPTLKLVLWNDEAKGLDWSPNDELPSALFECKGSADAQKLISLIGETPLDRILIITDGFWPDTSSEALRNWKDRLPPNALRIIKVGADANPRLRGVDVFSAEDFFTAMDSWPEEHTA